MHSLQSTTLDGGIIFTLLAFGYAEPYEDMLIVT